MTYVNSDKPSVNRRKVRENVSDKQPIEAQPSLKAVEPVATGLMDQTGARYVQIAEGRVTARAPLDLLASDTSAFWRLVLKQGITAASYSKKAWLCEQFDAITAWPNTAYIASTPGFHAGTMVLPDESVVGEPSVTDFQVVLANPIPLAQAGWLEGSQELLRRFVRGQPIPIAVVGLALAGPILRLSPYPENIGLELIGGTSTGKSTLLDLAASMFGAPRLMEGSVASTWRNLDFSIEQMMLSRSHCLLPLDEASHAKFGKGATAQTGQTLHLLSDGKEKGRYGKQTREGVPLTYLSTSNTPLAQMLKVPKDELNAAQVRLASISTSFPDGRGIWDHLPQDCENYAEASNALADAIRLNHGWIYRAFAERLVQELRRDDAGVRAKIAGYVARFMREVTIDPGRGDVGAQSRVSQKLAVMFAALRLASEWGVIPLKQLREPLLTVFRRWQAQLFGDGPPPAKTAIERVQAYVAANRIRLIDLDKEKVPRLTDEELKAHPGFLKTQKGRRCLLITKTAWNELFGPEGRGLIRELAGAGLLVATEGLQHQTKVRRSRAHDRVYAIQVAKP